MHLCHYIEMWKVWLLKFDRKGIVVCVCVCSYNSMNIINNKKKTFGFYVISDV